MASHNRAQHTLRALADLERQHSELYRIKTTLFDDGSRDGTPEQVSQLHPAVNMLRGDGSAYWARSMRELENDALRHASPDDYLLWLNDDVSLHPGAVERAYKAAASHSTAIIVGAMRDPVSGETTYSGFKRYGRHPLHYSKADPGSEEIFVDTLNGNFVLVPVTIASRLGGIDGQFSHSWADIDYGFRARDAGVPLVLLDDYVGFCSTNPSPPLRPVLGAWRRFVGPKGAGEPRSLARILRRHGGALWPLYFVATYGLWWVRTARDTIRARR